ASHPFGVVGPFVDVALSFLDFSSLINRGFPDSSGRIYLIYNSIGNKRLKLKLKMSSPAESRRRPPLASGALPPAGPLNPMPRGILQKLCESSIKRADK